MLQETKGDITKGWKTPKRGDIPFESIIAYSSSFYLIVESIKEKLDLTTFSQRHAPLTHSADATSKLRARRAWITQAVKPKLPPLSGGSSKSGVNSLPPQDSSSSLHWRTGGALCKQQNQSGKITRQLFWFYHVPYRKKVDFNIRSKMQHV